MTRRTIRDLILLVLPWLVLPVLVWMLYGMRGSLPSQVAVHFGVDGSPDQWVSRETFFGFALGVLVVLQTIFTARSLRARAAGRFYPMLVSQYILVAVVVGAIWQVVRYNRDGVRLSMGVLLAGVAAAVVAAALARRWKAS